MSQTTAALLSDAETIRVESGEKSTPFTGRPSLSAQTCLYVFASHTSTSPGRVPAAIHFPSLDTARQRTVPPASSLATCLPSCTRHTRAPSSPPLKRYSPSTENVTAYNNPPPTSISSGSRCSCPTVSINAAPVTHDAPVVFDDMIISDTT